MYKKNPRSCKSRDFFWCIQAFRSVSPERMLDTNSELFRVAHSSCFADDGDFHLTRIGHFILNLFSNVGR